jgi:hypothetical protein
MAIWDDSTKFKYETIRSSIFGFLGALAAILILNPWNKKLEYTAQLDKTKLDIRARVVDEFLAAAYHYTSIAYDACQGDPGTLDTFEDAFDTFRSTRNRLGVYFRDSPDVSKQLAAVDKRAEELGSLCVRRRESPRNEAWESARVALKAANNDVAAAALGFSKLFARASSAEE